MVGWYGYTGKARRQSVGDFLAQGMMRSCESKGGAAWECGVYTLKGHTPRVYEVRAGMWSEILDEATSNLGFAEHSVTHTEEFGLAQTDPFSPEEVPFLAAAMKGKTIFMDSLAICAHCTGHFIQPLVDLLNAATGWDFTKEKARDVGLRTVNLMRAYNLRAGIGPEVEMPSARLLAAPASGPARGKSIAPVWERMLANYYYHMGWDRATGKPLPTTLERLGLPGVAADLWGPK